MKTDKETEKILLNLDNSEYDKLMNLKIEQEFKNELVLNKNKEEKYIENIKDIPEGKLFSKFTVFEVINKTCRTKSYINGIQAEGRLGTDTLSRNKLLAGEISSFVCGDNYIKFIKCKI